MRNTKIDRRSERSRRLLSNALIALMLERRYDTITVQDILDRADIGRSTFYAHYLDKEDLLVSNFKQVLDALILHIAPAEPGQVAPLSLARFFRHIQEQQQLYRALVRGGGIDLLYQQSHRQLRERIETQLGAQLPAGSAATAPIALIADYMAGAALTMLRWWLEHGMAVTPEELDELFQQLVLPGVRQVLSGPAGRRAA